MSEADVAWDPVSWIFWISKPSILPVSSDLINRSGSGSGYSPESMIRLVYDVLCCACMWVYLIFANGFGDRNFIYIYCKVLN